MFNIQKYLGRVVLAVGLAAATLTAGAGVLPTYHITVANTASADISYVDFLFTSTVGTAPVTASLSHFMGSALSEPDTIGLVSETSNGFAIGSAGGFSDLFLNVSGPFAFDLNFSEGFLGFAAPVGSSTFFSIALYDSGFSPIGDPTGALNFSLTNTGVDITLASSLGDAVAVPEPTDWALMLTGLVFVVYMTRKNGRANARRLTAA
jgi:uncharacterized membrane protein YjfL (UPF0719 family)